MCCFFGPGALAPRSSGDRSAAGLTVEKTVIYARHAGASEQILAYQMALSAGDEVVMVLPLPVGSRDERRAVQFLNLENCGNLLDSMVVLLPVWVPPYVPPMDDSIETMAIGRSPARARLEVKTVGSYEASFVPSVADFDRLDPRFRVAPELWTKLGDYGDWGFAVFQLRDIARDRKTPVHPMAFRFVTRHPDALFFPTVHVHDGSVHATADFDHLLYFQADCSERWQERCFVDGVEVAGSGEAPAARTGRIRWSRTEASPERLLQWASDAASAKSVVDAEMPLKGFGMKGLLPNRDTWLHFEAPWQ